MVHSILRCLLFFFLTVMAAPKHIYPLVPADHPEDSQNVSASTTVWLYTPPERRIIGGAKRKHEGPNGDLSDKDVTLCWPNAALRECAEVSISRILYTNLKLHHVADFLTECFCVTEGYDIFESESTEPLFIDGTLIHEHQLHAVSKYTGDPLPHLNISFPDSSSSGGGGIVGDSEEEEEEEELDVICWPNPLLGECKEAEISHAELNDLLSGWNEDDFLLDSCTCASQGFSTAIKKKEEDAEARRNRRPSSSRRRESYNGVQTYSPTPRVTLCYFDITSPEHGLWETEGGREVQKGVFCKQVTIDRGQYSRVKKKKNFIDAGVSECKGGCVELGYSVLMESASRQVVALRPMEKRRKQGMPLQLIPFRYRKTSPGEWEYTYHRIEYDPRVTLCLFDGEEVKDSSATTLWWNTSDGSAVRKRELCKQVTISRDLYLSTSKAPGRKERFNKYGIYECGDGGCAQIGYTVLQKSRKNLNLYVREDTPAVRGQERWGGSAGGGEAPPPTTKKQRKNNSSSKNKKARGGGGAYWPAFRFLSC